MRSEAQLRRRLENLQDKKEKEKKAVDDKDKTKPESSNAPETNGKDSDSKNGKDKDKDSLLKKVDADAAEDFQLQRAIDLLRGIDVYNKVKLEK